jgi:hypothetical protein
MIEMIVKYFNDGIWGYIDNVRQVATEDIDTDELIAEYNRQKEKGERDPIELENVKSSDVEASNKAFLIATETFSRLPDLIGDYHQENLLSPSLMGPEANYPAKIILLYLNGHKEYDNVILITNQKTYLMNDEGKTIERLV